MSEFHYGGHRLPISPTSLYHIKIPAREFEKMKKAMTAMAQELQALKHLCNSLWRDEDDEVVSCPHPSQINDALSFKIPPPPPSANNPPSKDYLLLMRPNNSQPNDKHCGMEESLAERNAKEVCCKIFGEYALSMGYDLHKAQKRLLHPDLLKEPFLAHYKTPRIEAYTGTIDPNDHVGLFLALLDSHNLKDCFLYPT